MLRIDSAVSEAVWIREKSHVMLGLFIGQSPIKSLLGRWAESEKDLSAVQITHWGSITGVLVCAMFAATVISACFGQGDLLQMFKP